MKRPSREESRKKFEQIFGQKHLTNLVVPKLVGRGCFESLLEYEVPFPKKYPALELIEIVSQTGKLSFVICEDTAIVQGVLDQKISYQSFDDMYCFPCRSSDMEACIGTVKRIVFHIPFSGLVSIPGLSPGDEVEAVTEKTKAVCRSSSLTNPYMPFRNGVTLYQGLKGKELVSFYVKALRKTEIIPADPL